MAHYSKIIERFGLRAPTSCYPATVEGLQGYIDELTAGKDAFCDAEEVATPYHPEHARRYYGVSTLLPGDDAIRAVEGEGALTPEAFERFGAIWALVLPFRQRDGRALKVENWFRPGKYNAKVGGAESSDHLTANAVDLKFKDLDHKRALLAYLDEFYGDRDIALSLGTKYRTRVHVGVRAPATLARSKRRRRW